MLCRFLTVDIHIAAKRNTQFYAGQAFHYYLDVFVFIIRVSYPLITCYSYISSVLCVVCDVCLMFSGIYCI